MDKIINNRNIKGEVLYYGIIISSILGAWTSLPANSKIYLFHIIIAMYSINIFINMVKGNKINAPKLKTIKNLGFIFIWYIYIMITFFWARSTIDYVKYFSLYTLVFYFVLIVVVNNNNLETLKKTVNIVGILFIVSIVIGILEATTSFRLWGSPYMRKDFSIYNINNYIHLMKQPTAYFHNPNNLATFILFGIAFLMSYILYLKNNFKYFILLIFALLLLYLSNSRANWLGTMMIFIVFVYMKFRLNIKKLETKKNLLRLILLAAMTMFLIISIPKTSQIFYSFIEKIQGIVSMITSLDFSGTSDNSTRFRWVLIQDAFSVIRNNPLGVGAGNTSYYLGLAQGTSNLNVHNWFLELWVDFGFHFFVLYIAFYVILNFLLYKCMIDQEADKELRIIAGGCFMSHIGFIVGMMSPSGIIYFLPYWLLTALSFSVINIYRKTTRIEQIN